MAFDLLPAIDVYEGRVVRLRTGLREHLTTYSQQPQEIAATLWRKGARKLHLVDLDAAFGRPPSLAGLVRQLAESGWWIEIGGGLRSRASIAEMLAAGAAQVLVGSLLADRRALADALAGIDRDSISAALDLKDGTLAISGWTAAADLTAAEGVELAESLGIHRFVVTSTHRDGTGLGPDTEPWHPLLSPSRSLLASGGVHDLADLVRLRQLGFQGAIVGRAILDGTIDLEQALTVCA